MRLSVRVVKSGSTCEPLGRPQQNRRRRIAPDLSAWWFFRIQRREPFDFLPSSFDHPLQVGKEPHVHWVVSGPEGIDCR